MEHRLTNELVKETAEKAYYDFNRFGAAYRKGFLDDGHFFTEMERVFERGFWQFLQANKIRLRIAEGNYRQFAREYRSYTAHLAADIPAHLPWLYDYSETPCEASSTDQRQFFFLMRLFRLTPEFFEPAPEAIPRYNICAIHQYHSEGVYGTVFNCVDDGGLLKERNPVGKTYILTNDLGLNAVLTVKEDRRSGNRRGMDFDEQVTFFAHELNISLAEFLAEGSIEGYTAEERTGNPEILIRTRDRGTKIGWLAFWRDSNDEEAFSDFPLWQRFFRWNTEKIRKQKQILSVFFDKFKSGDLSPEVELTDSEG